MAVSTIKETSQVFHIGETFSYPNNVYVAQGIVGSNSSTIIFIINLPKQVDANASGVTFNTLNIRAFGVGGVVHSGSVLTEDYSLLITLMKEQGAIRVSVSKTNGTAWDVTAQTPVNIFFTGMSLTFN